MAVVFTLMASVAVGVGQVSPTEPATNAVPVSSAFYHQVWQLEDGLPHNDVHGVIPTPDGFLWVGTRRGLARFDGARFVPAQSSNVVDLAKAWIWRMGSRGNGGFLMALRDGLMVQAEAGDYQYITANGRRYERGLDGFCADEFGRLWMAAQGGEIQRISNGVIRSFGVLGKGPTGPSTLITDSQGVVWLASRKTVGYFEGDEFVRVDDELANQLLLAPASGAGVWLVVSDILCRVKKDQGVTTVARFPWSGSECIVRAVFEDRNGTLWVGTNQKGLFRFSDGRFESVPTSHNNILCLAEDHAGNLWVGTQGGGLDRISPRQFTVLDTRRGLPNDSVFSFAEDTTGRLWMATQDGGLCHWSNGVVTILGPEQGWLHAPILCLATDPQGGIWIGSYADGLLHWRDGTLRYVTRELGLKTRFIRCLLADQNGRLWAGGSDEGLLCIAEGRVTIYAAKEGLPTTDVRCLAADKQGGVWFGTESGELGLVRDGKVQTFTHPHRPGDSIHSLLVGPDGVVWLGTAGQGLLRFADGRFAQVQSTHGLPTDSISQLQLDQAGWLWCGSDRGLFRVKLADLNAVADGKLAGLSAFTFGRSFGLSDFQFYDDSQPASLVARSGRFWFASVKGAVEFDPAALTCNPEPPSVFIQAMICNGEPTKVLSAPALPAGVRRLEFRFVAPDLSGADHVYYRCKLEGISSGWSAASPARVAIYTNLPPGRYRFQVEACNANGVWNEQGDSVAFTVAPFFWQTGWFPPLALACSAGLLVLGSRWVALHRLRRRLRVLEQEGALERERTRIAQDIHDELGANLTSISWFADRGRKHLTDPAVAGAELEKIAATARESVQAMDGIVWALNQQNESLEHFANYLSHFAGEFFRPTPISCQLEIPLQVPEIKMSTTARHHLFLGIKEALNNVVRHSGAKEVWIRVKCEDQRLTISVEDNGRGIGARLEKLGEDGLANIRRRMASLQGTVSVEDAPPPVRTAASPPPSGGGESRPAESAGGRGTRVRFSVPFANLK